MKKYIDAEKFKNTLRESLILSPDTAEEFTNIGIVFAISRINSMPAADVAEVIRCKDCKWFCSSFNPKTNISVKKCGYVGYNPVQSSQVSDTDFCSHGEKE